MQEESYNYRSILKDLSKDWLENELLHRVSKEASNSFFELGKKWFFPLFEAKRLEGVTKNSPQFVHIRRQLYKKRIPPVLLEVAYKNNDTGEINVLKDLQSIPISKYPRSEYTKLYESAYVKVNCNYSHFQIINRKRFLHFFPFFPFHR